MCSSQTIELTGLVTSLAAKGAPARGLALQVESGRLQGQRWAIGARALVIGAGADCDILIDEPAISRRHAEIVSTRGGLAVRDLDSRNGTLVGGARIREAVLAVGAELLLGDVRLRLVDEGAPTIAPSQRQRFGGLVGASRAMREVFAVLELAAPSDATVLVQGPSGSGKELVARALHDHSPRGKGPFVVLDCSAQSRELLPSALFGHRKGAFTGAQNDRAGAFVEASGGTLFLDELGELHLELQTLLLRALESGQVIPVGTDRPRPVNVRVVAATHRDLYQMVEQGQFRLDLFHRLAVVHLRLPSLAERREDLAVLIRHFYEGHGEDPGPIEGDNLQRLMQHPFAGNVRELRNILERSRVLAPPGTTRFADLQLWMGPALQRANAPALDIDVNLPFKQAKEALLESFEARYLPQLMQRFDGNQSAAARHAGLSRRHLRVLLIKHGLAGDGA